MVYHVVPMEWDGQTTSAIHRYLPGIDDAEFLARREVMRRRVSTVRIVRDSGARDEQGRTVWSVVADVTTERLPFSARRRPVVRWAEAVRS